MKVRRKPVEFEARMSHGETVNTSIGLAVAYPGDWILMDEEGLFYIVSDAAMRNVYEPCEDEDSLSEWGSIFGQSPGNDG